MTHASRSMPQVTGTTDVFLIPADPVAQVRAPEVFNQVFARLGINAVLVPMHVPAADIAAFVLAGFKARNVRGMLLSIPHKGLVMDLLAGCGLSGRVAGAVNALRLDARGQIEGALFDGEGFVASLDYFNIPFRGKRVLVLGAGGSAAAIGVSLAEGGVVDGAEHIAFYDPVPGKAQGVAAKLDNFFDARIVAAPSADPAGFDLVVNASPLGLEAADPLPCDVGRMEAHAALVDILMKNQPTPLVRAARQRGLCAQPGFEMLIQQTPAYLEFFGYPEAAAAVRQDARFIRELIYPAELAGEIHQPSRYVSPSVA